MKDRLYDKITKNKLWFIAAIIFAALVASFPGFLTSTYIGKDLTFHIYRIQEMATNIKQGVWLPAVQSNNILGYGYLVDIFYPNLFLYPAAILALIISPLTAFKILIFTYNIFTFWISYKSSKITTNNDRFSFYFALFYVLYPYKILNFYLNGFVGEFLAYAFLPLVFFGVKRLFDENKWKMLAIGMIGILYSHLITLLLASIYIAIYCVFNYKKVFNNAKIIINLIKTTVTTVVIGSAFLVPFFQYIISDSYKYNLNADISGILSYGLINLPIYIEILLQILIIAGLVVFYNKNKDRSEEKFKSSKEIMKCFLILIYVIIALTKIYPWEVFEHVPFLRNIQFSLRILGFVSPIIIFIITDLAMSLKNMNEAFIIFFVSCMLISVNQSLSKLQENEEIINYNEVLQDEEGYQEGTFIDIIGAEYVPAEFTLDGVDLMEIQMESLLKNNKEKFSGEVEYSKLVKDNSLETKLEVKTNKKVDAYLPLIYYKNYNAYDEDGNIIEKYEKDGMIALKDITSGTITVRYEVDTTQKITALVSLLTALCFLINIINKNKKYLQKNKNMV